jgi:DNA-directed RNA polymerase II subunit RPB1
MEALAVSSVELKKVSALQFGILSPEEIRRYSVATIQREIAFEQGRPKEGGLMDQRLGAIDRDFPCRTCHCSFLDCPGHFGHIELAQPVYNPGFLATTLKVLRCVCYYCSKLLVNIEDASVASRLKQIEQIRRGTKRLRLFLALPRLKECRFCGNAQPKLLRDALNIVAEFPDTPESGGEKRQQITAEKAYNILKHISDEDADILGFSREQSRPDWMIVTILPVPPPHVRPSIMMDATSRGEDDLTHKLGDIVKANNALKRLEREGAPAHALNEQLQLLQYHVATYMNNEIPGLPRSLQRSGRPLKSISQRLKGKEGRIRGNLMGKRVDFSARTVITPDPNIRLDEVGVPKSIAMNLTYPEVVTPLSYSRLQALVANGPNEHPGAKYIVRDDGQRIDLRYVRRPADLHLEIGYKVERHLQDGDVVLFNRQPSLHKMSIMGHRVRILPYSTFRLNLSATSPYNADFDGDEMNLHVPQFLEGKAEILELMMVPKNIVSPQANKPVMGLVQDTLLGCSLFTMRDVFITRDMMMNLLMHIEGFDGQIPEPAILKPKELWTGKQLFSMITPNVNIVRFAETHVDELDSDPSFGSDMSIHDTRVVISGGELVCGIIDKSTVGTRAGSLIHVCWKEHGPDATCDFISSVQLLINHWLLQRGFSIGIGDTIADEETMNYIVRTMEAARQEVTLLIEKGQNGEIQCKPGKTMMESLEDQINSVLNQARNKVGSAAARSLPASNNLKRMVNAGSKGSTLNISQIMASVGQQNVEGKRIFYGFRRRTLPHYPADDLGAESRGFVFNSYLSGLTPDEFFLHAMSGREGIIDTAVKTSETGYIQRRLMKAMEDIMVNYDHTVRDSGGHAVQFLYGEDGMDGAIIERQIIHSMRMSDRELEIAYRLDPFDAKFGFAPNGRRYLDVDVLEAVHNDPELSVLLNQEFEAIKEDRDLLRHSIFPRTDDNRVALPVNIERLIDNTKKIFGIHPNSVTNLNPRAVLEGVKLLLQRTRVLALETEWIGGKNETSKGEKASKQEDSISTELQLNATLLFQIHIRATLATKRIITYHRLHSEAFSWLLGEIESRFLRAQVSPGEMIGAIAAQSIGEPTTQMTLNTFHLAGVSEKNVTLGVPRFKEVINVARNMKKPSLTVYLKGEAARDEEEAKRVMSELQYITLKNVVHYSEIYYDPDPRNTLIEEDTELVEDRYLLADAEGMMDEKQLSPWVLRFVLLRSNMEDSRILMRDIAAQINNEFGEDLDCIYSDDNAEKLVLRIRIVESHTENGKNWTQDDNANEDADDELTNDERFLKKVEAHLLANLHLRGIPGIHRAYMRVTKLKQIDEQTGSFVSTDEWVLDTEGTNLLAVLSHPSVDARRTISNDVVEVFEVLGIEASRALLLSEIRAVMEPYGLDVNYRHLAILADIMTHRGFLQSITRHGINRVDRGALAKSSFEETVDILLEAATFGELDDFRNSVSENIMMGQMCNFGTGSFGVLLNEEALIREGPREMNTLWQDTQNAWTPAWERTPGHEPATPRSEGMFDLTATPLYGNFSPKANINYSANYHFSPYGGDGITSYSFSPSRPSFQFSPSSPGHLGTGMSPLYSPSSPMVEHGYSPTSPAYSPTSPGIGGGQRYSPTSPTYSPTSPGIRYSPSSPAYSPTSPANGLATRYSPTSPAYSPTSPAYMPRSPAYSPTSPGYSPTSPAVSLPERARHNGVEYQDETSMYSPKSPAYSPRSPAYSPKSPAYSPKSPAYSPKSPAYSPKSPAYSPKSPAYSPKSPAYSPKSPAYSPRSPAYSPKSPAYSPRSSE